MAVVVAAERLMWQVALAAALEWRRCLQYGPARGKSCTPGPGQYGMRALLMHEDWGLLHARLC